MNGDGIPDFIVGKRVFAHNESYNDPDPYGPGVLYWYETVRDPKAPGGARFVPHGDIREVWYSSPTMKTRRRMLVCPAQVFGQEGARFSQPRIV